MESGGRIKLPRGYSSETLKGSDITPERLHDISKIREKALSQLDIREKNTPEWKDELNLSENTTHRIVYNQGDVVAAVRVTIQHEVDCLHCDPQSTTFPDPLPTPFSQITRLVTHPDHRNHGIELYLFRWAVRASESQGARCVACDANSFINKKALSDLQLQILVEAVPEEDSSDAQSWFFLAKQMNQ